MQHITLCESLVKNSKFTTMFGSLFLLRLFDSAFDKVSVQISCHMSTSCALSSYELPSTGLGDLSHEIAP